MKSSYLKRRLGRFVIPACAAMTVGLGLSSCEDELLTGMPSWLGSSIYEELQTRGNYETTLRLINDPALNYASVLQRTGSKTLFAADDAAFDRFFKKNDWGVKSYDDLSDAQKKMLFNTSMVNNAYLIELLSSVSGNPPEEGKCMRRMTSLSVFDSVPRVWAKDMPDNIYWSAAREEFTDENHPMLLMKDNTVAPMVHFLPRFMESNNITNEDFEILTNHQTNDINQAYVNGSLVTEKDKTCQNGYLQFVDEVVKPLDNMAEIIRKKPQFSQFSRLLERFSFPQRSTSMTAQWKQNTGGDEDIYVKRYFNTNGSSEVSVDDYGNKATAQLSFDPGNNTYIYSNSGGYTMSHDAGVMLVPTDEALDDFWNGEGRTLQEKFGSWDEVSDSIVVALINNMMLSSFIASVPSKFGSVVNSAQEAMGIEKADVDSCFLACNGVVYQVNRVFSVPDYRSVTYPALLNTDRMGVINEAISILKMKEFLNQMSFDKIEDKYSFIIPTNMALTRYIDPVSVAKGTPQVYEFYIDNRASNTGIKVKAHVYDYDPATGEVGAQRPTRDEPKDSVVRNRLQDILDNHLVLGQFNNHQQYYRTKSGGVVQVSGFGTDDLKVGGTWQGDRGTSVSVRPEDIFDMSQTGNGISYIIDEEPLMTTSRSVWQTLKEDEAYSEFFALLDGSDNLMAATVDRHATTDKTITFFSNYHYTIYVPTNESVRELIDAGKLPTWEQVTAVKENEELLDADRLQQVDSLTNIIENFLRYHIYDNALYIGGETVENGIYESSCLGSNGRFVRSTVTNNASGFTVKDNCGNVRRVLTVADGAGDHSNKLTRDYLFNNIDVSKATNIYTSSYAVIHLIDKPLFYAEDQFPEPNQQ
ncbi:MAG: hypothetical protein NC388_01710 [Clostridium sp.]|nr:hypothetical protein [Clostridium sp.]